MKAERNHQQQHLTELDTEAKWIQWMAGAASLIGLVGLFALLANGAHAAEPRKGFQPGSRPFANPFANSPGGAKKGNNDNFFDDEEDDDADLPPSRGTSRGAGAAGAGAGGGATGNANDQNAVSAAGVQVGGGLPGGVIEGKAPPAIRVDDETGEGSKEIVTDFNYPDADIMDIAKTLGKLTGKNFIIDKDVKGRITIISNSPITVGDAWKAFLTALDVNGFALIPSGKYVRIARQRDARDKQLKTYTGSSSPDSDALITRVFQLKYINAEEVARTFRSFMPANSRIIPYEQTNTVIVTDTGSNIAKLNKMLDILDVEGYDAGIEVIPVKFASAVELSKLIDTLIPGTGGGAGAPGAPRFGGGGGGGRFSARRTKEGGIINTIISDERTNNLIVHANTRGADQVRELVAKLDQKQPATGGAGGKVHVVSLQFAEAEAIANTMNNIASSAGGGFKASTPGGGGGGTGVNPVSASLFEGSIKISPDKATNALVITASPADFVTVQRVIAQLDIPRDEVYVEVVVMEVAIDRGSSFSANIASPVSGLGSIVNNDLASFIASPLASTGAVIGFKGGGNQTFTLPNGQTTNVSSVNGLIRAIQTSSQSNVLATPQIIALDNTTAKFVSAEKIPIPSSTAVQGAGVTTSIQNQSIELSIEIKPQINKISNFVKLETKVKLGDISDRALPSAVQSQAFATLDRQAETTVVVGDADTIVIGGLIRDKISSKTNKIPILGDIPVLGWLFKSQDRTVTKTNLLVFMTPHIVRQYEKVRALLDKKLKERDDFIEASAGGEDPLRAKRDEMIRSLPDINKFKQKPQTAISLDEPTKPAAVPLPQNAPAGNPAPLVAPGANGASNTPPGAQPGGVAVPDAGQPSAQIDMGTPPPPPQDFSAPPPEGGG